MSGNEHQPEVELILRGRSARFDASDPRWASQISDLHDSLGRSAGTIRTEHETQPHTKGGIETVILALGSAGAFTAAVAVIREWLRRDRGRSLSITIRRPGETQQYEVSGTDADDATLRALMRSALKQPGAP